MNTINEEMMRRIRNDLIDSYDKELETDLQDRSAAELVGVARRSQTDQDKENRR